MNDVFEMLMSSTCRYVASRIDNELNKQLYKVAMLQIQLDARRFSSLDEYLVFLEQGHRFWDKGVKQSWIWSSNERRYTLLAYEHSFDILNSVQRRFVHGTVNPQIKAA